MELTGERYVFAVYAIVFLVLMIWLAVIAAKVRRLDAAARARGEQQG